MDFLAVDDRFIHDVRVGVGHVGDWKREAGIQEEPERLEGNYKKEGEK